MTNTIPNVPRDCGHAACKSLGEPHPFCKFVSALDATPSPAGVDGLEVVAWWLKSSKKGEDLIGFGSSEHIYAGVYDEKIPLCDAPKAQAIIDGLRGDATALKEQSETRWAAYVRESNIRREVEQQRDQLADLLREARQHHGVMLLSDPPQDAWKFHGLDGRIDAALSGIKEPQ